MFRAHARGSSALRSNCFRSGRTAGVLLALPRVGGRHSSGLWAATVKSGYNTGDPTPSDVPSASPCPTSGPLHLSPQSSGMPVTLFTTWREGPIVSRPALILSANHLYFPKRTDLLDIHQGKFLIISVASSQFVTNCILLDCSTRCLMETPGT